MNHHFIKGCVATPKLVVADCHYNTQQILDCINEADDNETEMIVFPELAITGYTCGDLFYQQVLLQGALKGLDDIIDYSKDISMMICVGLPLTIDHHIFNCAVIIRQGKILGVVPKDHLLAAKGYVQITLCNQTAPFSSQMIFKAVNHDFLRIGVVIGEDASRPLSSSSYHALAGATIILNLAAKNEIAGNKEKQMALLSNHSASILTGYLYASAGTGESSTDGVYAGYQFIYENGELVASSKGFERENNLSYGLIDTELIASRRKKSNGFNEKTENVLDQLKEYTIVPFNHLEREYLFDRRINPSPFVPKEGPARDAHCLDVLTLQTVGLAKRLEHVGTKNVVIGISGGLDSTLALIVCVKAFKRLGLDLAGIVGVTMPGFGTTDRTYHNSISLMKNLGITIREISIVEATLQHFKDIGHDPDLHDITYENTQARERTQILMDIANQVDGLVIGTGDLSELALGWATYNGDHMSMYAVNSGVPKTLVKFLIQWAANNEFTDQVRDILMDVFETPVSPELLPPSNDGDIEQKTEEIVGPYLLHDFYLYYVMRHGFSPQKIVILAQSAFGNQYDYSTIVKWIKVFYRRFFTQQFKRSCLPDGPQVVSVSLSPREGWKMPSDAAYNMWLSEIELL